MKAEDLLAGYVAGGVDFLRTQVPEIQRLEALEELADVRLVRAETLPPETPTPQLVRVEYEGEYAGEATEVSQAMRTLLSEHGIGKAYNIIGMRQESRAHELYLSLYEGCLRINLRVTKP